MRFTLHRLASFVALTAVAALPAVALAQTQKVLKFIPQADLRILDPISTTAYGMPYDYVSVMHYSKSVGALSNGMITIETTNKAFQVFTFIRNENFLVKCG